MSVAGNNDENFPGKRTNQEFIIRLVAGNRFKRIRFGNNLGLHGQQVKKAGNINNGILFGNALDCARIFRKDGIGGDESKFTMSPGFLNGIRGAVEEKS